MSSFPFIYGLLEKKVHVTFLYLQVLRLFSRFDVITKAETLRAQKSFWTNNLIFGMVGEAEIDRLPIDLLAHIFVLITSFTDLAQ